MKCSRSAISDVLIFEPVTHEDDRGYFMETFRLSYFHSEGINVQFVQDNQSMSKKGTLRGLHYQLEFPQGKLVRVISGEVFDVAVDLRKSSNTFGKWVGQVLSSSNKRQFWIPPGFAHGFLVLSERAELVYKCTDYFNPDDDHSLIWNDPDIAIHWPATVEKSLLSRKDSEGKLLTEAPVFD